MSGEDGEYAVFNEGPVGCIEKLGNSCKFMCIGLVLFPVSLVLLGSNERHTVCEGKNINFAEANAKELKCSSAGVTDEFGYFACPILDSSMKDFTACDFYPDEQCNGQKVSFKSISGSQTVEMAQCTESCTTETKDKEKITKCSYDLQWTSSYVAASGFKSQTTAERNCIGFKGSNPPWPAHFGQGKTTIFTDKPVQVGDATHPFVLNDALVKTLSPDTIVTFAQPGSVFNASVEHFADGFYANCASKRLGCLRIKYEKSGAVAPSVLAHVGSNGQVSPQDEPASWLCSADKRQWIKAKKMSFVDFIADLRAEAQAMAWILRLVGILLAWLSVFGIFSPITAAADVVGDFVNYIPCVGGFLEDFIEGMATSFVCLLSCGIGCGCGFMVISIVWLAMRPLYGIGFLIVACGCCACGAGIVKMMKGENSGKSRRRRNRDEENE